jgi:hypothetical protein
VARVNRRLIVAPFAAVTAMLVLPSVALAHGDHDARPLARQLEAGPFSISLWQVYPDTGDAMTPHLIVMFDGAAGRPAADVSVAVNGQSMLVRPSTTSATGWETTEGVAEGDTVAVAISDGGHTWQLDPLVVPPPPTSLIPMQELIYVSIFLTIGTAWWVVGRTARAWRRPAFRPG